MTRLNQRFLDAMKYKTLKEFLESMPHEVEVYLASHIRNGIGIEAQDKFDVNSIPPDELERLIVGMAHSISCLANMVSYSEYGFTWLEERENYIEDLVAKGGDDFVKLHKVTK